MALVVRCCSADSSPTGRTAAGVSVGCATAVCAAVSASAFKSEHAFLTCCSAEGMLASLTCIHTVLAVLDLQPGPALWLFLLLWTIHQFS